MISEHEAHCRKVGIKVVHRHKTIAEVGWFGRIVSKNIAIMDIYAWDGKQWHKAPVEIKDDTNRHS